MGWAGETQSNPAACEIALEIRDRRKHACTQKGCTRSPNGQMRQVSTQRELEQKQTLCPTAALPGTGLPASLSVITLDLLEEPTPTQQEPEVTERARTLHLGKAARVRLALAHVGAQCHPLLHRPWAPPACRERCNSPQVLCQREQQLWPVRAHRHLMCAPHSSAFT